MNLNFINEQIFSICEMSQHHFLNMQYFKVEHVLKIVATFHIRLDQCEYKQTD